MSRGSEDLPGFDNENAMPIIDETHDPDRASWVTSANGHKAFPIQNLPHGVFSPDGGAPRGGVAIGEKIFDVSAADRCIDRRQDRNTRS